MYARSPSCDTSRCKKIRRNQIICIGIILFLSIALSVVYIVLRHISTTEEETYNWTLQLPVSTRSLNMQAWNNRLVGSVLFTPAPATDTHYTINIKTTVVKGPVAVRPWTLDDIQESGFFVSVSDLLPNAYKTDYVNITVHIPSHHSYSKLTWNTYPISNRSATLPFRKWNIVFNSLTDAGIKFENIRVITDAGLIHSDGISAGSGHFQTSHGPISGEYTIPSANLTFGTNGGS
ncbi:hypothetical protein M408DRAFT_125616 [Serendipita vermifera MAFF 305830]|uniref:Uncharacterized protein n=1 Tax=Serendipita vermifera MAFF 305830 TaxID=933852 RepID=A0A0C3B9Y9_SERVB|nr:hypothetical protein M408DRAFT_125616 [Serendipita vermifera MAFF 305830]